MDETILVPMVTSMFMNQAGRYGAIISLLSLILSLYGKTIWCWLNSRFSNMANKSHFKLTATISMRNNCLWHTDFPKTFLAVNQVVNDYIVKSSKCKSKNKRSPISFDVDEYHHFAFTDTERPPVTFFTLTGKSKTNGIQVTPNIKILTSADITNGEKGYVYTTLIITVESTNQNYADIKQFVDDATRQYNELLLTIMKEQHIFVLHKYDTDIDKIVYQEIPFQTTKTFASMFFDKKDTIIQAIDNFTNNVDEYKRLGIPHTLGFMFHGIKGASKTSCAKSIAKYTKRHVVIIPMRRIKDIDTLKRVFLDKEINGVTIPNSKRLYVFEEIDCGSWGNALASREHKQQYLSSGTVTAPSNKHHGPQDNKNTDLLAELISALKQDDDNTAINSKTFAASSSTTSSSKYQNSQPEINLGEFLELLDGMIEIPGRMIIMTSNRPEILDDALLRPGRIDYVIEFKHMTRNNIRDLYKLWFDCDIPKVVYDRISNDTFTQAEIGNIFSTRDLDMIHHRLTRSPDQVRLSHEDDSVFIAL